MRTHPLAGKCESISIIGNRSPLQRSVSEPTIVTTGRAALRGGFRGRVRRVYYFLWLVKIIGKNVRNHESSHEFIGWSLTTGSAALRGGFRVRVRVRVYYYYC